MIAEVNRGVDVSQGGFFNAYLASSSAENAGSRSNATVDITLLQDQFRLLQRKLEGLLILKMEKDDAGELSEDIPDWYAVKDRVYRTVANNADQIVKGLQNMCHLSGFDISSLCIVKYLVQILLQQSCDLSDLDQEMIGRLNNFINDSEDPLFDGWQHVIYDQMYFRYQHTRDCFEEISAWMDKILTCCSSPSLLEQEVVTLEGNYEKIAMIRFMIDDMRSLMNRLNHCWWLKGVFEPDLTDGISALNDVLDSLHIMTQYINELHLFKKSSSTEKLSMTRHNFLNKKDSMVAYIKKFQQVSERCARSLSKYLKGTYLSFRPDHYERPEDRYQLHTEGFWTFRSCCQCIIAMFIYIMAIVAIVMLVALFTTLCLL